MRNQTVVEVNSFMDGQRLVSLHIRVLLLCALVAFLDGANSQIIGVTAPALAAAVGVKVAAFGPIFSANQFGAMLGALGGGTLADRFGRKPVLIASVLLFSLFTLATPLAGRFDLLLAVRIAAGLGLGGATPCFLALMSDYAPKRYRATLVSLVWCGFPLGGMLGSLGAAYLISHVSWQAIFLVGGLAPLAVALVLAAGVQESPQFHLGSGRGLEKARRTLARFAGWPAGDDVELISAERKLPGVPLRHLFGERRALFTPLLWGVFAAAFGTLTVLVLWTPALLKEEGVAAAQAAIVVAVSNLGAMIGQGSAGRLVDRLGPVRVMAPAFFVGAVFFALLTLPGLALNARFVCAALAGACLGLSSSGAIALTAVSYPAQVRSSAIGWGMAVGRGGQVVAPLLAGAILGWGAGPAPVFIVMAAVPIVGALFVLLLAGERRRASPPVAA